MKFIIKKLEIDTGRPVAFISQSKAKKMNLHAGEKIEILFKKNKIIAILDLVKGLINKEHILLSEDILSSLKAKPGDSVEVSLNPSPKSLDYILKKVNKKELSKEEIFQIISDIVDSSLSESETAYFVSAVYENGMSLKETIDLTEAIFKTGDRLVWDRKDIVDKHCIGGIAGNRTTPIVVSICAAAGVIMPKTSSRAITSASGTADVIETIARVDFSAKELQSIVKKAGACLAWNGGFALAPADDKLIRVERLLNLDPESQLIASILAKKLSVGSKYVLIDIPYGAGAKVTKDKALKLGHKFVKIGNHFKIKVKIVLTDGSQPIGNGIGPILEMKDVLSVLGRNNSPQDLEKKATFLSSIILEMTGKAKKGKGLSLAKKILDSGQALNKFKEIISLQEGKLIKLKPGRFNYNVIAQNPGKIIHIDNKGVNNLCRVLGCPIDKAAGIYLFKKKNSTIKKGDKIMTLYAESKAKMADAIQHLMQNNPIKISE